MCISNDLFIKSESERIIGDMLFIFCRCATLRLLFSLNGLLLLLLICVLNTNLVIFQLVSWVIVVGTVKLVFQGYPI